MIRDLVVRGLAVPLLVVALLAGLLGFFVTRQVARPPRETNVRLSVVALPQAATPSPTPEPTAAGEPSNGTSSGGGRGGSGQAGNCPAGCQCTGQPGGIVIICH